MNFDESLAIIISLITVTSGLFALIKIGYTVAQLEKSLRKEVGSSLKQIEDGNDVIIRRLDGLENKHVHRAEISELRLKSLEERTQNTIDRINERLKDITGYLEKQGFNRK